MEAFWELYLVLLLLFQEQRVRAALGRQIEKQTQGSQW